MITHTRSKGARHQYREHISYLDEKALGICPEHFMNVLPQGVLGFILSKDTDRGAALTDVRLRTVFTRGMSAVVITA